MMLEAKVLDMIAEREEEMVLGEVSGAEHRVGFLYESLPFLRQLHRRVERTGRVGDQIHFDRPGRGVQRDDAKILARDDRGVDQRRERDLREVDLAAVLRGYGERRPRLPAIRQLHA